jgi:hypothetical protein
MGGNMKNIYKGVMILAMFLMLSGCDKTNRNAGKLELYILRHVLVDKDIAEFVRDESSIFTGKDIKSYDWDTHTITFTDEFLEDKNDIDEEDTESFLYSGSQILGVFYPDQFALYLEGEELYRGYMKPQVFISFMPTGPMISDVENGIEIRNVGNVIDKKDLRDNKELHEFLKDNNMLSK